MPFNKYQINFLYKICRILRPLDRAFSLMSRVFANGLEDQGSIPGQVIPKTQKMVLDATVLSTQHYKVRIKGKVGQFREWRCTILCNSVL